METQAAKFPSTSAASTSSSSTDKMNYALQVALQTMKERCIQLQSSVSNMEKENQLLRQGNVNNATTKPRIDDGTVDAASLRSQIDELQRQKKQLEDQISMVSNENRRLWSRLSKISKDQAQLAKEDGVAISAHNQSSGGNQNLIRSKTFTQHSPNPHLRQKMISDGSLEDIALEDTSDFDPSEELGYPYGLQVEDTTTGNELDTNVDAKHCMEGLQDMRREAMKQQQALNAALIQLENRFAMQSCPDCTMKAANKPEMADKSLETEDRLTNELKRQQSNNEQQTTTTTTSTTTSQTHETYNGHSTIPTVSQARLNIIQEKLKADAIDKTCPMCGKLYSSQVSFKAFQEHVEMHFIDDTLDADGSMDRQFEFISHAVGDF